MENLLLVVLLVLMPVASLLFEYRRQRMQIDKELEPTIRQPAPPTIVTPAAPTIHLVTREPARAVAIVPSPPAKRGRVALAALATRSAQRRAIVLMTILRPCRADDPPQ